MLLVAGEPDAGGRKEGAGADDSDRNRWQCSEHIYLMAEDALGPVERILVGIGFGTDTNGLGTQASPRPHASNQNPVTYPFMSVDNTVTIHQSQWSTRSWDFNQTGALHYGLFLDWIEDPKHVAGQEIVDDLARGAEAYLQMWERASTR
jgi:hypothetical protein